MAKSFTAQIKNWTEKAKRNADLVMKQSTMDVIAAMTSTQPGVGQTGGAFEIGKVPVDTGFLINSLVSELNGSQVGEGADSYHLAIAGMELGDTVQAAFTAEYATAMEYGTASVSGRFFVREAVLQWQSIVDQNAARLAE